MDVNELIFGGKGFRTAPNVLQAARNIFRPNSPPVQQPYHVHP
jgi:hypothetical protein